MSLKSDLIGYLGLGLFLFGLFFTWGWIFWTLSVLVIIIWFQVD